MRVSICKLRYLREYMQIETNLREVVNIKVFFEKNKTLFFTDLS